MNYRAIWVNLFLVLLFFSGNVFAQTYAFKVLASKGNNTIDGQAIKVGTQISDNQTLIVSEGAYLSLAHHSGKAIEVPAGRHKVQDLSNKIAQNQSITAKYAKFVVNELTQEEQNAAAARNRFQHMNKTGSVERDLVISSVRLWLPLNSMLMGQQLLLKWSDVEKNPNATYQVQISDLSEKVLFSALTKEKELLIDLVKANLHNEPNFIVKVLPVDAASGKPKVLPEQIDGSILIKPENETVANLKAELAEIQKEFGNRSAIGKLAEANLFEENNMIANALLAYEEALKISGGVPQYKELYNSFLLRNAFLSADSLANLNK
ncbi:MAG: hypothetical protein RMJ87_08120 [Cytophagales bacterium]|nr:hypothetical protein [Bernardetiaceae bacterium]MDW8204976.1 hypothetical protein [Cytophagales bacterium]